MAVALLTLDLYLPMVGSLKEKRGILLPIIHRLRREYNVSVCEAGQQDEWTRAVLEVACVSTDSTQAHRLLQKVAANVEHWRLDAQLIDYEIEMLG